MLLMLLYGGYSLWDTNNVMNGGFISDELLHYKPTGVNDCARLQELMAKNPDVVGWVTIDGTNIDYPFVQGKDNQEYLNKNVLGESAVSGAVFLDTRNSRAMTDSYNLLYAHHMDNGAMFGDVDRFLDRASLTCTARARSTQKMGRSACASLLCVRLPRVMTLSLGRETWTRPQCRLCSRISRRRRCMRTRTALASMHASSRFLPAVIKQMGAERS
ncbi:MAG: class B sortase [Collinsella sp.]